MSHLTNTAVDLTVPNVSLEILAVDICIRLGRYSQRCDVASEELIGALCTAARQRGCMGHCLKRCGGALFFSLGTILVCSAPLSVAAGFALLLFPATMAVMNARLHRKGSGLGETATNTVCYC